MRPLVAASRGAFSYEARLARNGSLPGQAERNLGPTLQALGYLEVVVALRAGLRAPLRWAQPSFRRERARALEGQRQSTPSGDLRIDPDSFVAKGVRLEGSFINAAELCPKAQARTSWP